MWKIHTITHIFQGYKTRESGNIRAKETEISSITEKQENRIKSDPKKQNPASSLLINEDPAALQKKIWHHKNRRKNPTKLNPKLVNFFHLSSISKNWWNSFSNFVRFNWPLSSNGFYFCWNLFRMNDFVAIFNGELIIFKAISEINIIVTNYY